jgi:hypothetical protein
MIRIASEKDLFDSFRPLDQGEVALPENLDFPLDLKDYLAWTEPSGHRVFLLFTTPGRKAPLGIVFKRDSSAGSSMPASMCEWCHSVRAGDGVTLLTATASSRRTVGIYLCRDLSCKNKSETAPSPDDLPQSTSGNDRVRRIVQRMSEFATRNIF